MTLFTGWSAFLLCFILPKIRELYLIQRTPQPILTEPNCSHADARVHRTPR